MSFKNNNDTSLRHNQSLKTFNLNSSSPLSSSLAIGRGSSSQPSITNNISIERKNSNMPTVLAKVTHLYEYIRADLVNYQDEENNNNSINNNHDNKLLGSFSTQTFQVDASDILNFDPRAKLNSLINKLSLIDNNNNININDNDNINITPTNTPVNITNHFPFPTSNIKSSLTLDKNNNPKPNLCGKNITIFSSSNQPVVDHIQKDYAASPSTLEKLAHIRRRSQPMMKINNSNNNISIYNSNNQVLLTRKNSMRRKESIERAANRKLSAGASVTRKESNLFSLASGSREVKRSKQRPDLPTTPRMSSSSRKVHSNDRTEGDRKNWRHHSDNTPLTEAHIQYLEQNFEKHEIVLRKEEGGFGLSLTGSKPVLISSVKPNGVAAKNGVLDKDIVFKINGQFVCRMEHEEVVSLFQNAGQFMSLILLRRPNGDQSQASPELSQLFLRVQNDKVSKPVPVSRNKNLEFEQSTFNTLKNMHAKALQELKRLEIEAQKSHSETAIFKFENQAKVVDQLEKKILMFNTNLNIQQLAPDNFKTGQEIGSPAAEIISMEAQELNAEDDDLPANYKEFEDLELLKKSPVHLACFIKFLIDNGFPGYMLFTLVVQYYNQSSFKDSNLSLKWAYEIFSTFVDEDAPLRLLVSEPHTRSILSCLIKDARDLRLREVFNPLVLSVQSIIEKQLEEFRNTRKLGLGGFFGESYLPSPNSSSNPCLSSNSSALFHTTSTAPILLSSLKPSFLNNNNHTNANNTGSNNSVNNENNNTILNNSLANSNSSHSHFPLSSSSFSSSSSPFLSNNLGFKFQLNSSNNTPNLNYDPTAVEKILWEDFSKMADDRENYKLAIAVSLATIFRHTPGFQIRVNSLLSDFPAFLCKEKRALKNGMKKLNLLGHPLSPHQFPLFTKITCSACSTLIWGVGYQAYKCNVCDINVHKYCLNLLRDSCSSATRKLTKDQIKPCRDDTNSTFYCPTDLNSQKSTFNSLPNRKRNKLNALHQGDISAGVLSDSEAGIWKEHENSHATTAFITSPLISQASSFLSSGQIPPSLIQPDDPDLFSVEFELPSLSSIISQPSLSLLDNKMRKKQEIINELFYTERSHLKTLKIMFYVHFQGMVSHNIDNQLINLLFPNLENIIKIHKEINDDFLKRKAESEVVQEIGDILVHRFIGENGTRLQEECSQFCKDQYFSLQLLRDKQKQDNNLNNFIFDAAQNHLCRKLELKDFLPKVMQRLTKYPLLVDNLIKNTIPETLEHKRLETSLLSMKKLLDHVNQVVRECENFRRTQDMQKRLEVKQSEDKDLVLTNHKMIYDGDLTLYQSNSKTSPLHVALFEDIIVLMHKVDNKLVLKSQNAVESSFYKHKLKPIIKLSYLMTKDVPRDNRSFYLVSASKDDSQMFKLTARSSEERNKWTKYIKEAVENYSNQYSNKSAQSHQPYEAPPDQLDGRDENNENENLSKNDIDDGDDTVIDHVIPITTSEEDEVKRQIRATHELMIENIMSLSDIHHIEPSPLVLKVLPLTMDSWLFYEEMTEVMDAMALFFENLNDSQGGLGGESITEAKPIDRLLSLSKSLHHLLLSLQQIMEKNKDLDSSSCPSSNLPSLLPHPPTHLSTPIFTHLSSQLPPPLPLSEPPEDDN